MFTRRIPWLLVAACCWQLTAIPSPVRAASSGSSSGTLDVNFFYDNLKNDGSWFNTVDYGDVWQPYIAYKSDSWRPYTDGYWSYTDGGWMFVSYEDFGWAVYHYGRWTQLKDIGWAWVPGTEWAPAWVTWRESKPASGDAQPPGPDSGQTAANVGATTTDAPADTTQPPPPQPSDAAAGGAPSVGQNYVGWAPLPPDPGPPSPYAGEYAASGYAYGPSVDVDYGIDPYDYSFVDARFFGAPFLGAVIFDPVRSYYCCGNSVNVTNFYYNDRGGYRGFYNGGPRYERFQGVSERAVPRYNINREQGRAAQQAVRAGQFNQVNGNRINVAAPRFSQTNVHNGRVNFTHQGTLPVTQVGQERPANAVNNEARQRAQTAFRQQGEAFRTQNPNAPSVQRANRFAAQRKVSQPASATDRPEINTPPRAQQEEHAARQEARQEGPDRNAGANPTEAAREAGQSASHTGEAANQLGKREETRAPGQEDQREKAATSHQGSENPAAATEHQRASHSTRRSSGSGRRQQRSSAPRVVRQSGGGGGHRGGGGGHRGGGGGQPHGGGGGGHKEGGGGGKKH